MITTQRLIIIGFMFNILLGATLEFWHSTDYNKDQIDLFNEEMDNIQNDIQNEDKIFGGIKSSEGRQYEPAIMASPTTQFSFFGMIGKALNPASINPLMFDSTLEQSIATLFMFLRTLLVALVAYEGFLIFRGKKST